METFAARRAVRRTTGHYRKPGTDRSYCGHDLDHTATPAAKFRAICKTCTKAEARDRAEAEQVAADHREGAAEQAIADTLTPKMREVLPVVVAAGDFPDNGLANLPAGVTFPSLQALIRRGLAEKYDTGERFVGFEGRRYKVEHFRATDLGRAVAAVLTAEQADAEQTPADESARVPGALVDPWTWIRRQSSSEAAQAAADRAERRQQLADSRGANAYPLAVAAVRAVVRELPQAGALRVPVVDGAPEATLTRDDLHALAYSGHTTADAVARVRAAVAAHICHGEREVHEMFPAHGMRPALYLPDVMALLDRWEHDQAEARKFERAARALDAVEHAEQAGARVETVEDAEALYAAALVTEAEATDGTWRGAWIGEQADDDALFAIERPADQGALFDDRATAPAPTVREQQRAALARIRAKADADRAAHRAATDDEIAAECAAHGVPVPRTIAARIAARTEQAPARRVVEGVVVQHAGTATGSTPADADHPNVIAARAALDGLAAATMTDHHDVTDPTEDEQHVRGYLVDPREGDRVAVYWLEGGRIIRRDDPAHGPALACLADRLARRGWAVEKMLRSSQCVFAHRPSTD